MASTRRTKIWLVVLLVTLLLIAQAALLLTAGVDPSEISEAEALDSALRSDSSAAIVPLSKSPGRPFSIDNPSTPATMHNPEALAMLQRMYGHYLQLGSERTNLRSLSPAIDPGMMVYFPGVAPEEFWGEEAGENRIAQWFQANQPILNEIDRLPETKPYWTQNYPWARDVEFKSHLLELANSRFNQSGTTDTRKLAIDVINTIPLAETLGSPYLAQFGWTVHKVVQGNAFAPLDWQGLDWSIPFSAVAPPDFTAFAIATDERAAAVQKKILEATQTPADRLLIIFSDNSSLQPLRLAFRSNRIYADINDWRASTYEKLSRMRSITDYPSIWKEFPCDLRKVPGMPPHPSEYDFMNFSHAAVQMVLLDAALGLLSGDPVTNENIIVRENALTRTWNCRIRVELTLSINQTNSISLFSYRLVFESKDGVQITSIGSGAQFNFATREPLPQIK